MSDENSLPWLNGRKVALCDSDVSRIKKRVQQLEVLGLEVAVFSSMDDVLAEIERQHYTTYRKYLVVLVALDFALAAEQTWVQVTDENPSILETPVTLMYAPEHESTAKNFMKNGYIRFMLKHSDDGKELLRLMRLLNRWKRRQHSLSETARPAVKFD